MTPLIKLDSFYLKREDLNITGSAKDRAIPLQIENLKKLGYKSAVISSTGNAAISAIYFCKKNNIDLTIFLSSKTDKHKFNLIKKENKNIIFSDKPISDAFKFAKKNNAYFLRQSTDPVALLGYQKIGEELIEQLPQITSIFIPVGSGTTLLGISQKLPKSVKIFSVKSETNNLTDALTVKFQPLKNKIQSFITNSQGSELKIADQEIISCQKILEKNKILTSPEGGLTLAGYYEAIKDKFEIGDYPVILLTGAKR